MARVGIVGAGAIGSALACLCVRHGDEVELLARGERAATLKRVGGVAVGRRVVPVSVVGALDERPYDVVVVAVPATRTRLATGMLRRPSIAAAEKTASGRATR